MSTEESTSFIAAEAPPDQANEAWLPFIREIVNDRRLPKQHERTDIVFSLSGYRIVREIGRGGMGVVYEAEQELPHRLVAIKLMNLASSEGDLSISQFRREALALGMMRHSGIATIYESGQTAGGQFYVVMELVEGVTLSEYVIQRDLSLNERIKLFCKICEAVSYAHQYGIIHRDLKPANIRIDRYGNPKLLDFGLAKFTAPHIGEHSITCSGRHLIGTLKYMSPEQTSMTSSRVDERSDVYALGIMLFELLTGTWPYHINSSEPYEAIRIINEESPPKPSSHRTDVDRDLDAITLKALEKSTDLRYASVRHLKEDLERYQRCEAVLARPASFVYELRKLLGRHRLPSLLVVSLVGVILLSVYGLYQYSADLRVQRDNATAAAAHTKGLEYRSAMMFKSARREFERAMEIRKSLPDVAPTDLARDHYYLAHACLSLQDWKATLQHAQAAIQLMRSVAPEAKVMPGWCLYLEAQALGKLALETQDVDYCFKAAAAYAEILAMAESIDGLERITERCSYLLDLYQSKALANAHSQDDLLSVQASKPLKMKFAQLLSEIAFFEDDDLILDMTLRSTTIEELIAEQRSN